MSTQQPISPSDVDYVSVKSTKKVEYKVLCCGNSALDLVLIPSSIIGVYILTGVLFALCTHAVIQTTDTDTALWMFFGIYVLCVVMLGIVLIVTGYDKEQAKKYANAEE